MSNSVKNARCVRLSCPPGEVDSTRRSNSRLVGTSRAVPRVVGPGDDGPAGEEDGVLGDGTADLEERVARQEDRHRRRSRWSLAGSMLAVAANVVTFLVTSGLKRCEHGVSFGGQLGSRKGSGSGFGPRTWGHPA